MTSVRCRNCSAPVSAALELPRLTNAGVDIEERDYVRVRLYCTNCQTHYVVEIDIDEFEAENVCLQGSYAK